MTIRQTFHFTVLFMIVVLGVDCLAFSNIKSEKSKTAQIEDMERGLENPDPDPKGLTMYEEYFGEKDTKPLIGLREFTINHLFAHIYSRSEKPIDEKRQISLKDRCMISVALLTLQRREKQLKSHMKAACHLKISKEKILEIMGHVGNYGGLEAEVFGIRIACQYYKENTSECNKPDELTDKERCMTNVSLAAAQGREDLLKEHIKQAWDLKIPLEQMLEIAIHVAHYAGWPTGNFVQEIAVMVYKKDE